jgi:4-amino-4-deoxy-L-arabinose transferase-like glycosyltransferase
MRLAGYSPSVLQTASFRISTPLLLGLWLAALPLLLAGLGTPVVQRTQEARVLETAREMLDSQGWRQWMIPRLNGEVRLQKPPLAYWLAAGSFRLFGINDFAGRLPFALAGWLTLALVYRLGKGLADARFGLTAAAILLTSFMFFRHFRLAETDSLAALFVTAAIYWFWRGARDERRGHRFAAFHLAGIAVALAVLAKGPPALFPVLFFIAWVIVERDWASALRWITSGALLTTLIIGGWWFLYVRSSPMAHELADELFVVTGGEDHVRPFYQYFPQILVATAPWTGLFILGLIWGIRDWRRQPAARVALLWVAVILIPLCCIGNKQNHYLVPLTPALALLAAYAVRRGLQGGADARAAGWVMAITLAVSLLTPIGVYWLARHERGFLQTLDLVVIVLTLAVGLASVSVGRKQGLGPAVACYAGGLALCFAVMIGRWRPSLEQVTHRTIAAELEEAVDDRPIRFYGRDPSFPLVWNLHRVVPVCNSPEALQKELWENPQTVVIAQTKNNRPPPPIPPELKKIAEFDPGDEGMIFNIYVIPQ